MAAPQRVKHRVSISSSNSTPSCLPKRTKNTCLHKHLNDHSSISHNSPQVKTAQMSISWWMDKHNVVWPHSGILLSHKKEWRIDGPTWMNLGNIMIRERSPAQKTHMTWFCFYEVSRWVLTRGWAKRVTTLGMSLLLENKSSEVR